MIRSLVHLPHKIVVAVLLLCLPIAAGAQTPPRNSEIWVQLEAHPSLEQASERAAAYAQIFKHVQGHLLRSGWYGIAIGPYNVNEGAQILNSLRNENMIPYDSYLTDGREFGRQYWPMSGGWPPPEVSPLRPLDEPFTDQPFDQPMAQAPVFTPPQTEPFVQLPPADFEQEDFQTAARNQAELTFPERQDIQRALQWFGLYSGALDGAIGPGTQSAIAQWQQNMSQAGTGVLTSRQRTTLLANYEAAQAEYGFGEVNDPQSALIATLPLNFVEFDNSTPPFVQYRAKGGSGLTVMLISQPGDQSNLAALYAALESFDHMPKTGPRQLRGNQLSIEGENGQFWAKAEASLSQNHITGWLVIGDASHRQRDQRVADVLAQSLRWTGVPVAPVTPVAPMETTPATPPVAAPTQQSGLAAGLDLSEPKFSQSGTYISANGMVLTSATGLGQCSHITLDRKYDAQISYVDPMRNLAILRPTVALAPPQFAQWQTPTTTDEVVISGYPYGHRLTASVLTPAKLRALSGLGGEPDWLQLDSKAMAGDLGGPVLTKSGAVIGILSQAGAQDGRQLPQGSVFARASTGIAQDLAASGTSLSQSQNRTPLSPEQLSRLARNITVLVSCKD